MYKLDPKEILVRVVRRAPDNQNWNLNGVEDFRRRKKHKGNPPAEAGLSLTRIKIRNPEEAKKIGYDEMVKKLAYTTPELLESKKFKLTCESHWHVSLRCSCCDEKKRVESTGATCIPSDTSSCPLFKNPDTWELLISIFRVIDDDDWLQQCHENGGIDPLNPS